MTVIDWLLDSDPAIRWQVMRDLLDAPSAQVEIERSRVATHGWGAQILSLQSLDGKWDGGTYRPGWADDSKPFFDAWTSTTFALQQLTDFGLDPADSRAQTALARVRDNVRWEATDTLFFEGETEPCINGLALTIGSYFGQDMHSILERLVTTALPDGGWNCWAQYGARGSSFSTTINVLEGLLAAERASGTSAAATTARRSGEDYLLERGLMRRLSTGRLVDPRFTMFSYPTRWYYDTLRALDYFRSTGQMPDQRCAEAVQLLIDRRDADGRWRLENTHQGPTHLDFGEQEGAPSRWITLHAMRVLRWWDSQ
ncbi:prenyltransferase/squalene oxidase repeat-containing protein [Glaciibacter psychrotolerans]|uniref:Squalene cyclase n=1 Tax=Glaciibacter psychrotolerans TaxID=670054 RepID=A0A7Z0EG24_9MICO|nr:hypothetical protein [Leifsonia psychrotolerans]NYJ21012.1 hypothetical protein [Leifsonia psychrotolerans]